MSYNGGGPPLPNSVIDGSSGLSDYSCVPLTDTHRATGGSNNEAPTQVTGGSTARPQTGQRWVNNEAQLRSQVGQQRGPKQVKGGSTTRLQPGHRWVNNEAPTQVTGGSTTRPQPDQRWVNNEAPNRSKVGQQRGPNLGILIQRSSLVTGMSTQESFPGHSTSK